MTHFNDQNFSSLTVREYAAIHLMVPDSGDVELDKMISKAIQRKRSKCH
jgi:hypothetical protein